MAVPISQLLCEHPTNPVKYTGLKTGTDEKWARDFHPITKLVVHTTVDPDGETVLANWDALLPLFADDDLRGGKLAFPAGLLIISDVFPKHRQGLGGAVFNTCAQLGTAIGLSVTQAVVSTVTSGSPHNNKSPSTALLEGYKAAFWVIFGWMIFALFVCAAGLRRVRQIGLA